MCEFIIREVVPGLEDHGLLYIPKFHRCDFGDAVDALRAWGKNDCNETDGSPTIPAVTDLQAMIAQEKGLI